MGLEGFILSILEGLRKFVRIYHYGNSVYLPPTIALVDHGLLLWLSLDFGKANQVFVGPHQLAGYFTPVSSIEGHSQLRSAAAGLLLVPWTWTVSIGPRAFAVSSPAAWNTLPAGLHDPSISLPSFRKKLTTYLFNTPT